MSDWFVAALGEFYLVIDAVWLATAYFFWSALLWFCIPVKWLSISLLMLNKYQLKNSINNLSTIYQNTQEAHNYIKTIIMELKMKSFDEIYI